MATLKAKDIKNMGKTDREKKIKELKLELQNFQMVNTNQNKLRLLVMLGLELLVRTDKTLLLTKMG